jgi:hypothetical protein
MIGKHASDDNRRERLCQLVCFTIVMKKKAQGAGVPQKKSLTTRKITAISLKSDSL